MATNDKIDHLSRILLKKAILKDGAVDINTMTSHGISVDEFRMQKRRVKAHPKPHTLTSDEVPPIPVKEGSKLDQIRKNNMNRVLSKFIKSEAKLEDARKKEVEELGPKGKKPRKLPKIPVPASMFPNRYVRGELPCTIEHGVTGQYLSWACPLENLDYEYYLPVFFEGIRCKGKPCSFLARQGIEDMLFAAKGNPDKIIPCIKPIARPLKHALSLFDSEILLAVLKSLQQILEVDDSLGNIHNILVNVRMYAYISSI
jgi:hypothetical protein